MTTKKRPLNIGLGKMLSQANIDMKQMGDQLRTIPLELIEPGAFQPRKNFHVGQLEELADSMRTQGVLQPIVLRQIKPQRYEIIAGERRWRAAQIAGLGTIPALIKEISNQTALAIGLIENIQRENLNPLEEAKAFARLIEEFALTHDEVAQSVGKSRALVSNLLRLLQLDERVQRLLEQGVIDMGHARALLSLKPEAQYSVAQQVVKSKYSVRATEQLVKTLLSKNKLPLNTKKNSLDPNLVKLEGELSDHLGTSVRFIHKKSGAGSLVIDYPDLTVLEGVLRKVRHQEL